jgi:hypothetical protein
MEAPSLHGGMSPQRNSTAEMLAREYQDALESDIEAGHDHETRSTLERDENDKEENDKGSYSFQCLAVEEQKITLELEKLRERIEQDKTRETYLAGISIGIRQSMNKLKESGL